MTTHGKDGLSGQMVAIAILSAGFIAYQVTIIQLLSLTQWYHFANMVISVALLGFGAAGTVLALGQDRLLKNSDVIVPVSMILCGLAMVISVAATGSGIAAFDSYLLFVDRVEWINLLVNYLLYFLPFLFGALALGIVFTKRVEAIHKLYFADLAGAALGALMASVLSWYFRPEKLAIFIAFLSVGAGLSLVSRQNFRWVIPTALVAAGVGFYLLLNPPKLVTSQYKSISRTLNLPSAKVTIQKPGPFGFVEVVSAEGLRYAPGLSLAFTGEIPVRKAVFNNGDWVGAVVSWRPDDTLHLLDFTTSALPYALTNRNDVLILHSGTGLTVSHAIANGASHVDVVESHPGIAGLLKNELAVDNDSLFYHAAISTHVTEPRTFLFSSTRLFDLIELPMIGSFGGTAGLYAMREEYILTKESFHQQWKLLKPDGVVSITTWMDYPFRNPLRIVATLAEVMDELKLNDPRRHFIAIRGWGTITFLLKRSPFTSLEINSVREFCNEWFYDPVLLPDLKPEERAEHHVLSDTTFFIYVDQLMSDDRARLYNNYAFYLEPPTDDRPYFSQFIRWRTMSHLTDLFGTRVPFLEMGILISALTFVQLCILAIILIILPLFRLGWKRSDKSWLLLYFASIGCGYMLLEIVFIQRFILFFGNPVYAVSFVIGIMLLFSGVGSYWSYRFNAESISFRAILMGIVIILLVYAIELSTFLNVVSDLPTIFKLLVGVPVIGVPAFFMGMPFPVGLRLCSWDNAQSIPWAWGINGCLSVISAAAASLIAVEFGFMVLFILAACCYVVCWMGILVRSRV